MGTGCPPRLIVIRTDPLSRCNSFISVVEISRTSSFTSWLRAVRLGASSWGLSSPLFSGSLTMALPQRHSHKIKAERPRTRRPTQGTPAMQASRAMLVDTLQVFSFAGVDLHTVTLVHEERHLHADARLQGRRLERLRGAVT